MNYDAAIIGSGPNGLAAAIRLQQQGLQTLVVEQATSPGGSVRTEQLTLPGFQHDVCSSIHPLAFDSPFFKTLDLEKYGLEWVFPDIPFVQPLAEGDAIACYRRVDKTAGQLQTDRQRYHEVFERLTEDWPKIVPDILSPFSWPKQPLRLMRFGINALRSAQSFVHHHFSLDRTRNFFYGAAAHSTLPLDYAASAAFGMVLMASAHHTGWPFPKHGAVKIMDALISCYRSIGGELITDHKVKTLSDLPDVKAYLFDITPHQLLTIEGVKFPSKYIRKLQNYRYGAGVFKIDWALGSPIPWLNEKCRKAGTVHLGFSPAEIGHSEKVIYQNKVTEKPYVLLAQHSVFDSSRAPQNKHTAWAYCHVPNGSTIDMTSYIEAQIELAAPGFKTCILGRSTKTTVQMQAFNPNLVGGDINGGIQDIRQLFTRPVVSLSPYSTPDPRVFICSSSTPPGGGVHGMCGYNAAEAALRSRF